MQLFVSYLWLIHLVVGAYLWSYTLGIGRPESHARATAIPRWVLAAHPFLALVGITSWAVYSASDSDLLAWASLATLLAGAALGVVMGLRTHPGRRERIAASTAAAVHDRVPLPPSRRRVEDEMPTSVLLLHGLLATGLIAAVLVECLRVTF